MLIGLKDRVLLEQAYRQVSGDNLINEEIVGNTGFVYHRTPANPAESEIWNNGLDNTKNERGMYGPGLYCTYKLESQMGENMVRNYGKYIIRGKVNLSNFFIFSKSLFKLARPSQNYFEQYKKHNLLAKPNTNQLQNRDKYFPYDKIQELLKIQEKDPDTFFSSDLAAQSFQRLIWENKVSGLAFRGRTDGYVAVIYKKNAFIPQAYTEDDGKTWISMKSNVANILKPESNNLAADIDNKYVKSSLPRQAFKQIMAQYKQNKKLTEPIIRNFLKYCIQVARGGTQKRLTEDQYEIFRDGSVNIVIDKTDYISFEDIVTILPVKFNFVQCGAYYAPHYANNLKNSPNRIKGSMIVASTSITSLNGCPAEIYGDFTVKNTLITTLEGGPDQIVTGTYECSALGKLQSLNGLPRVIGEHLDINYCPKLKDITAIFKTNIGQDIKYKREGFDKYPVRLFVNSRGYHHLIDDDDIERLQQKGLVAPSEDEDLSTYGSGIPYWL